MSLHSETSALILDSWVHYHPRIHELTVRAFQILFLKHPETRDDVAAVDRLPTLVTDGLNSLISGLVDDGEGSEQIIEQLAETLVYAEADTDGRVGRYLGSYREALIDALREDAPRQGLQGSLRLHGSRYSKRSNRS